MTKYEILYVISPQTAEDAREKLIKKFSEHVTKGGGTVEKVDKWGIRKLAYPIKFKNEGFYVLMTYQCEPKVSAAMEALMQITDEILREIVIKK